MQIFCSRSAFECFKRKVCLLRYYCGPATPFAGSGEDVSGRSGEDVSGRSGEDVSGRSREDVSGRSREDVSGRSREVVSGRSREDVSGRSRCPTPYSSLVEVLLRSAIQRPDRFPDQAFLQTN